MKILQINNYAYNRGGAETVFFNLVDLLKSKNHEVITIGKFGDKSKSQVDYLVSESQFFLNRFYSFKAKEVVKNVLKISKPDVVHLHNIIGGVTYSILPIIKQYNIPTVISIHDFRLLCPTGIFLNGKKEICEACKGTRYYNCVINNCSPEGYFRSSMIAIESYLRDYFFPHSKYFDAYIFVSRFTQQKFLEFYPNLKSKSFILYNFTKKFSYQRKRGNYYLFLGRLDREKGVLTLLKAFSKMKNLKLFVLGVGPFEKFISDFNSNGNIIYAGFKSGNDLINLIINSQYVVIPSECYENMPMSAVESLSFGKPIITSGLGGLEELLDDGKNGFNFKPGNVESLIETINEAHSKSDEEYFKMSENCFQFAKKHFDPEFYYQNLKSIYQAFVNN